MSAESATAIAQLEELAPISRVMAVTGCSRTRIYALLKTGDFPAPLRLGGRSLWVMSEVQAWIRQQIRDRPRVNLSKHG